MKRVKIRKKYNAGFTLIEVLASIAILSFFLSAVLLLLLQSYTGIFRAGNKSRAVYTAQQTMENQMATGSNFTKGQMVLHYGSTQTAVIPGGYTSVASGAEGGNAAVNAFVPLAPTMEIDTDTNVANNQSTMTEGNTNNRQMTVTIQNFAFDPGTTVTVVPPEVSPPLSNFYSIQSVDSHRKTVTINQQIPTGTYKVMVEQSDNNILVTTIFYVIPLASPAP